MMIPNNIEENTTTETQRAYREINIGLEKAIEATRRVGGKVAIPELETGGKCDFNDLRNEEGERAVRECFSNSLTNGEAAEDKAEAEDELPKNCFREGGLFWYRGKNREPEKVSNEARATRRIRNEYSSNWSTLIEFRDPDGVAKTLAIPESMLAGDCREARELLFSEGLKIYSPMRFNEILRHFSPKLHTLSADRVGWYGHMHVLPASTLGDDENNQIYLQLASVCDCDLYRVGGTLEDWKASIARYMEGNSRLTLMVTCTFASTPVNFTGTENFGLHLMGPNSFGKTTLLRVAASVFGGPSYLRSWRATDNGLESIAATHNDAPLILDEIGQVDPEKLGEMVYMLASGEGKPRSRKDGTARKSSRWRLLFLSSGEIDLVSHMAEGKRIPRVGQELRILSIPAEPLRGEHFGAFENLHGFRDGTELSRHLVEKSREHYGTASREFIDRL
ncbi:MAG: DUF927 domain-containing protein [Rickettsiales bacterium]|jgi:putative DNA primase/helicase|nr:DUF927 domain-containing protein [Rickettsiales bacterium]